MIDWIRSAPKRVVLAGAVAVTWGCWLAHTYGVNVERARWEKVRMRAIEQIIHEGPCIRANPRRPADRA